MNNTERKYETETQTTACSKQPEVQEGQIEEQMNVTSELLDRLNKYISVLEGKLKEVLRNQLESDCNDMEQIILVPLAEKMRSNNTNLNNRINELENIIDRLEV